MSEAHEQRALDSSGEETAKSTGRSRRKLWIVFLLILLAASVAALAL